jgi:uncharacterized protein
MSTPSRCAWHDAEGPDHEEPGTGSITGSQQPAQTAPVPGYGRQVISAVHLILYVRDQRAAASFWRTVLDRPPVLDVPGMTEFGLGTRVVLGLMPEAGIKSLLGSSLPDPAAARGIPRAEVYLVVPDAAACHARALAAGAAELSPLARRSWGDDVAYSLDPDGHVLAFASRGIERTLS